MFVRPACGGQWPRVRRMRTSGSCCVLCLHHDHRGGTGHMPQPTAQSLLQLRFRSCRLFWAWMIQLRWKCLAIVPCSWSTPACARNACTKLTNGLFWLQPNWVRPARRQAFIASNAMRSAGRCHAGLRTRSTGNGCAAASESGRRSHSDTLEAAKTPAVERMRDCKLAVHSDAVPILGDEVCRCFDSVFKAPTTWRCAGSQLGVLDAIMSRTQRVDRRKP